MQFVSLDSIVVPPDRARKVFDATSLAELRESIQSKGLFHPLLLQRDRLTLVAGERRLRVLRDIHFDGQPPPLFDGVPLPSGSAPFVVVGSADELALLQSEFDENKRRADLSWQEEANFISRIHQLMRAQDPSHTRDATRVHLQRKENVVMGALTIAPFLADKEIANAKTMDEGLKILERKLQASHRESLAKQMGGVATSELHTLHHGDLRVILPQLPASHFDCLIADPPYGVNADTWDNMSAAPHPYADTESYSDELIQTISSEGWRVCKPDAHAYIFCDSKPARVGQVLAILSASGWRVWPWPLIYWRGPTSGVVPWPEHGPRRTFECLVFAIKGNRRTLGVFPDVLIHNGRDDEDRGAHKPTSLYADLIGRSCLPGDRLLDPCLGVGSILDAATSHRVRATGIEIEASCFARAQERLK